MREVLRYSSYAVACASELASVKDCRRRARLERERQDWLDLAAQRCAALRAGGAAHDLPGGSFPAATSEHLGKRISLRELLDRLRSQNHAHVSVGGNQDSTGVSGEIKLAARQQST